jgi:hypothetical protein
MIHEDNAAGRLWTIFNEVRSGIGHFGPKDAWSSALKLENPSEIEYHTAMIGAYGVLLEVHDELQSLNGLFDTDRYTSYFKYWGQAFGLSSDEKRYEAEDFVTQAAMDVLATLADILHGLGVRSGVSNAAKEAADTLLTEVTELINTVLSLDDIDPDFRTFLLEHLSEIEGALRRFYLRGYREVDAVIGKIIGDAVRNPGRWATFVEHPIWEPFKSVFRTLNLLSRGSQDAMELSENAKKLLELPF